MASDDIHPLQLAGEALYGSRFAVALEEALGVSDRTLRRWLASDPEAIPAGVWRDMRRLLAVRARTIAAVGTEIDWIMARLPPPSAAPPPAGHP